MTIAEKNAYPADARSLCIFSAMPADLHIPYEQQ